MVEKALESSRDTLLGVVVSMTDFKTSGIFPHRVLLIPANLIVDSKGDDWMLSKTGDSRPLQLTALSRLQQVSKLASFYSPRWRSESRDMQEFISQRDVHHAMYEHSSRSARYRGGGEMVLK